MSFDGFLSKLTDVDRNVLRDRGEIRALGVGEVLVKEGEVVNDLCIIKTGNLRVIRALQHSTAVEFAGPLGPGDAIGEISFVDQKGASATVVADGDVEFLAVSRPVIETLRAADPAFSGRLFESLVIELARKLRSTNQRVLPSGP